MILKEASKQTGIPVPTLKRACEVRFLKGMKIYNKWIVSDKALRDFEAEFEGRELVLPKSDRPKQPQPEQLRRWAEQHPGVNKKRRKSSKG